MFEWFKCFTNMVINKVLIVKEKIRTRTNGFKQDKFRYRKVLLEIVSLIG